eukprot:g16856.t1
MDGSDGTTEPEGCSARQASRFARWRFLLRASTSRPTTQSPYQHQKRLQAFLEEVVNEPMSFEELGRGAAARPSYGALASFLSTGIKQDGQLIGVFCTQMPPESKPVQVTEMQPLLDKAVDCITTVVSSYLAGYGTCTTVLDATSWEIMLEESSLLRWRFFVTSTEFALLTHGFSQNWLNASAMGLEEHKGFLVIEASKSTLADALWAFKLAWDAFRETDAERLLSLQIAYILLNPFPTGEKDKLDRAEGIEEYHAVHAQYHPTHLVTRRISVFSWHEKKLT